MVVALLARRAKYPAPPSVASVIMVEIGFQCNRRREIAIINQLANGFVNTRVYGVEKCRANKKSEICLAPLLMSRAQQPLLGLNIMRQLRRWRVRIVQLFGRQRFHHSIWSSVSKSRVSVRAKKIGRPVNFGTTFLSGCFKPSAASSPSVPATASSVPLPQILRCGFGRNFITGFSLCPFFCVVTQLNFHPRRRFLRQPAFSSASACCSAYILTGLGASLFFGAPHSQPPCWSPQGAMSH